MKVYVVFKPGQKEHSGIVKIFDVEESAQHCANVMSFQAYQKSGPARIEGYNLTEGKENLWEVNNIMNENTGSFEISVIRVSNKIGHTEKGLFGDTKIFICEGRLLTCEEGYPYSDNSPFLEDKVYEKMLKLAEVTAAELNCENTTYFSDLKGLNFRQNIQYTGTGNLNYVLPKDFKDDTYYKNDSGNSMCVKGTKERSNGIQIYFHEFLPSEFELNSLMDNEFVGNWVEITREEWDSLKGGNERKK